MATKKKRVPGQPPRTRTHAPGRSSKHERQAPGAEGEPPAEVTEQQRTLERQIDPHRAAAAAETPEKGSVDVPEKQPEPKPSDGGKAAMMEKLAERKEMREHLDHEKEHEEWSEECIRSLGGGAHSPTEMSKLVTELPHLFHALLSAELLDNAGWELLVQLADEAADREAKREFEGD